MAVMSSSSCRRWISVRIDVRSFASRLESGSSKRKTSGSRTMARPRATRCFCPPESSLGLSSSSSSMPIISAVSFDLRLALVLREVRAHPEAEGHVLPDGLVGVERVVLEHHRDVALARVDVRDVLAVDRDATGGGLFEPGEHPQRRRLPTARGTDDGDELTVGHVQRDVVDGTDTPAIELLREVVERDCCHVVECRCSPPGSFSNLVICDVQFRSTFVTGACGTEWRSGWLPDPTTPFRGHRAALRPKNVMNVREFSNDFSRERLFHPISTHGPQNRPQSRSAPRRRSARLAGCVGVQEQDTETAANDDGGDGSGDDSADQDTETAGPAGEATAWYSAPGAGTPRPRAPSRRSPRRAATPSRGRTSPTSNRRRPAPSRPARGPRCSTGPTTGSATTTSAASSPTRATNWTVDLDVFTDAAADAVQFEGQRRRPPVLGRDGDARLQTRTSSTRRPSRSRTWSRSWTRTTTPTPVSTG